jgi:hypothetical protein
LIMKIVTCSDNEVENAIREFAVKGRAKAD